MIATDPFDLLGLPPDAPREAVRRAYRKLAMRWHPDRNQHSRESEERFKEIKAAHDLALDPAAYEAWRERRAAATAAAAQRPQPAPADAAAPLEQTLRLSLEAAARGGRHTIRVDQSRPCTPCGGRGRVDQAHSVPCPQCRGVGRLRGSSAAACPGCAGRGYVRQVPCTHCAGNGRQIAARVFEVRIPTGVRHGDTLRLAQADGSVLLRIEHAAHALFTLHGDDLHCRVPVDRLTWLAGGDLTVPTLTGVLPITLPPASERAAEAPLRIPDQGFPRRPGRGAGDLVLQIDVVELQDLTASERAQLGKLAATLARHAKRCAPAVHAWQARVAAHAVDADQ